MKVVCIMVTSVDGKTTKGGEPNIYSWTSKEDQKYFFSTIYSHDLIVMGKATFESVDIKPEKERLRIVLTKNPEKFKEKEAKGQLEFSNETPRELAKRLEKQGFTTMLLVGGMSTNTAFFKENLVDELLLTIEPKIFGEGKMIVSDERLDIDLELARVEKLNPRGTLLLQYKVRG